MCVDVDVITETIHHTVLRVLLLLRDDYTLLHWFWFATHSNLHASLWKDDDGNKDDDDVVVSFLGVTDCFHFKLYIIIIIIVHG